jgi:hypothetical protein
LGEDEVAGLVNDEATGFCAHPGCVVEEEEVGLGELEYVEGFGLLETAVLLGLSPPWNMPSRYCPEAFLPRSAKAQSGCFS